MRLEDGQSARIPVIVGLSRCGGGRGSALAPGRYDVRVDYASENPGDHAGYISPPAPLTIDSEP